MLTDFLPLDSVIQIQSPERGDSNLLVHELSVKQSYTLLHREACPLLKSNFTQKEVNVLLL